MAGTGRAGKRTRGEVSRARDRDVELSLRVPAEQQKEHGAEDRREGSPLPERGAVERDETPGKQGQRVRLRKVKERAEVDGIRERGSAEPRGEPRPAVAPEKKKRSRRRCEQLRGGRERERPRQRKQHREERRRRDSLRLHVSPERRAEAVRRKAERHSSVAIRLRDGARSREGTASPRRRAADSPARAARRESGGNRPPRERAGGPWRTGKKETKSAKSPKKK